jgi:hypothetical protein
MIQDGIIPTPVPQRMNDMSNERIIGRDFPITIAGCGVTSVFYIDICFVELYGFGAGDIWDSTSYHFSPIWAFVGSVMAKKIAGEDVAGAWLHIGSPCMIRLDGVFTGSWFEFSFSGWGTEMRGMMG